MKPTSIEELPKFLISLARITSKTYDSGKIWTGIAIRNSAILSFVLRSENTFSISRLNAVLDECKTLVNYDVASFSHTDVVSEVENAYRYLMNPSIKIDDNRLFEENLFNLVMFDYYACNGGKDMEAVAYLLNSMSTMYPSLMPEDYRQDLRAIISSDNRLSQETVTWLQYCLDY
ncbi:hypothetical protein [Vibrio crassostreae]|uniref:hypothetical protein n=1 Tax=Vibrio crassostreae TaxID=246167 RepID=UPI001B30609F|nr:hypothetical protein [Vibrio crassostreae]